MDMCQDTGCGKLWKGQGRCVNMTSLPYDELVHAYDLSSNKVNIKNDPPLCSSPDSDKECCRCLKPKSCLDNGCEERRGRCVDMLKADLKGKKFPLNTVDLTAKIEGEELCRGFETENCCECFKLKNETKVITECEEMCSSEVGEDTLMQYPFSIAMDHTGSQGSSGSLIKQVIAGLNIQKAKNYQLVTFNDIPIPIEVYPSTTDYTTFIDQVNSVTYQGGGDGKERMFKGLLEVCQESPEVPLILVTTDHGTHDLELEGDIKACLEDKKATLIIVFNPRMADRGDQASLDAYKRLADSVINIEGVYSTVPALAEKLMTEIVTHVWTNCECSGPAPPTAPPAPTTSAPAPYS